MAFFQQCTATTATFASAIADSAGASGDAEMVARAGRCYGDALRHFSNYSNWQWMLVEAPTLLVTSPFSPLAPGGGAAIAGSATGGGSTISFAVGNATGFGVLPMDFVQGAMFAGNAAGRVTATATAGASPNTTATIGFADTFNSSLISTAGVTAFITANRDCYDIPTDWKEPYDARLVNAQYTIQYVGRRFYDRSVTSEFLPAGSPLYYSDFFFGQKGKIQLLRPPASTDRLQLRYYRRSDPTSATVDFPDHWAPYLLAYGKWLFLTDKADGTERAQAWLNFAMEGMKQMLKDNATQPDENLMFTPGHYSYNAPINPNSTRQILWDP